MADLVIVSTADGEAYYLTEGDEVSDSAEWSVPVDFNGKRYLGETDGDAVTLSIVTECAEGSYDEADEGDDEEDGETDDDAEEVPA